MRLEFGYWCGYVRDKTEMRSVVQHGRKLNNIRRMRALTATWREFSLEAAHVMLGEYALAIIGRLRTLALHACWKRWPKMRDVQSQMMVANSFTLSPTAMRWRRWGYADAMVVANDHSALVLRRAAMKVWYRKVRSYWALYRDANGMRRDAATAAIAHLRQIKWHGWIRRSTYDQTLANKADAQFAITALKAKRSCWRRWPNRRWPRVTAMAISHDYSVKLLAYWAKWPRLRIPPLLTTNVAKAHDRVASLKRAILSWRMRAQLYEIADAQKVVCTRHQIACSFQTLVLNVSAIAATVDLFPAANAFAKRSALSRGYEAWLRKALGIERPPLYGLAETYGLWPPRDGSELLDASTPISAMQPLPQQAVMGVEEAQELVVAAAAAAMEAGTDFNSATALELMKAAEEAESAASAPPPASPRRSGAPGTATVTTMSIDHGLTIDGGSASTRQRHASFSDRSSPPFTQTHDPFLGDWAADDASPSPISPQAAAASVTTPQQHSFTPMAFPPLSIVPPSSASAQTATTHPTAVRSSPQKRRGSIARVPYPPLPEKTLPLLRRQSSEHISLLSAPLRRWRWRASRRNAVATLSEKASYGFALARMMESLAQFSRHAASTHYTDHLVKAAQRAYFARRQAVALRLMLTASRESWWRLRREKWVAAAAVILRKDAVTMLHEWKEYVRPMARAARRERFSLRRRIMSNALECWKESCDAVREMAINYIRIASTVGQRIALESFRYWRKYARRQMHADGLRERVGRRVSGTAMRDWIVNTPSLHVRAVMEGQQQAAAAKGRRKTLGTALSTWRSMVEPWERERRTRETSRLFVPGLVEQRRQVESMRLAINKWKEWVPPLIRQLLRARRRVEAAESALWNRDETTGVRVAAVRAIEEESEEEDDEEDAEEAYEEELLSAYAAAEAAGDLLESTTSALREAAAALKAQSSSDNPWRLESEDEEMEEDEVSLTSSPAMSPSAASPFREDWHEV